MLFRSIPLLLYNYEGELFHLRLGESSLTQLYREFLTEALLTECNSSTCCHLIDNQKGKMIPDSAYRLEVKIRKNETCARIKLNQSSIPWFEGEMLEVVNNKIRPAASSLAISIRLTQKEDCLLDKTYSTEYQQTTKAQRFEDSPSANAACLDDMTECLSMATKETREKYKQGDEWVDDPNDADISTFRECYESTKDIKKEEIGRASCRERV